MSTPHIKLLWVFEAQGYDAAQRRFVTLANRLGDDYEHVVCPLDGDFAAEEHLNEGVRWRRLDVRVKRGSIVSFGNMWSFRKALQSERPSAIVGSNWEAVEWMMVNRGSGAVPHVQIEDAVGADERLEEQDGSRAWARRRAFPGRKRAFVAPTTEIETMFSDSWGVASDDVAMIPVGVDLDAHRPRDVRAAEGPVVLGVAGPLIRDRRVDRALRIAASLRERGREVRIEILGEGVEREALETEARTLGLEEATRFLGADDVEMRRIADWDVFIGAGDRLRDAGALAVAMACGLPAAATRVGDAAAMLATENALFVRDPADESALAAATELLVADAALRARIGAANRLRAEAEFGVARMVERFDEIFREMAGGAPMLMLPPPNAGEAVERSSTPSAKPAAPDEPQFAQAARTATRPSAPTLRPLTPGAPGQLAAIRAAARAAFEGPDRAAHA